MPTGLAAVYRYVAVWAGKAWESLGSGVRSSRAALDWYGKALERELTPDERVTISVLVHSVTKY